MASSSGENSTDAMGFSLTKSPENKKQHVPGLQYRNKWNTHDFYGKYHVRRFANQVAPTPGTQVNLELEHEKNKKADVKRFEDEMEARAGKFRRRMNIRDQMVAMSVNIQCNTMITQNMEKADEVLQKKVHLVRVKPNMGATESECMRFYKNMARGYHMYVCFAVTTGFKMLDYQEPEYGNTGLHAAVKKCHIETVEEILKYKGSPDVKNRLGNYPIHEVRFWWENNRVGRSKEARIEQEKKTQKLLFLLLSYGGCPDVQDAKGWTPLHWSCKMGGLQCILTILGFKANTRLRTNDGETAIMVALRYRNIEFAKVIAYWGSISMQMVQEDFTLLWRKFLQDYEAVISADVPAKNTIYDIDMDISVKRLDRMMRGQHNIDDELLRESYRQSQHSEKYPKPWEQEWGEFKSFCSKHGVEDILLQLQKLDDAGFYKAGMRPKADKDPGLRARELQDAKARAKSREDDNSSVGSRGRDSVVGSRRSSRGGSRRRSDSLDSRDGAQQFWYEKIELNYDPFNRVTLLSQPKEEEKVVVQSAVRTHKKSSDKPVLTREYPPREVPQPRPRSIQTRSRSRGRSRGGGGSRGQSRDSMGSRGSRGSTRGSDGGGSLMVSFSLDGFDFAEQNTFLGEVNESEAEGIPDNEDGTTSSNLVNTRIANMDALMTAEEIANAAAAAAAALAPIPSERPRSQLEKRRLESAEAVKLDAKFYKFTKRPATSSALFLSVRTPDAPLMGTEEEKSLMRMLTSQGKEYELIQKHQPKQTALHKLTGVTADKPSISTTGAYNKGITSIGLTERDLIYKRVVLNPLSLREQAELKYTNKDGGESIKTFDDLTATQPDLDAQGRRLRFVEKDLIPPARKLDSMRKALSAEDARKEEMEKTKAASVSEKAREALAAQFDDAGSVSSSQLDDNEKLKRRKQREAVTNFLKPKVVKYGVNRITSTHRTTNVHDEEPWSVVSRSYLPHSERGL